MIQGFSRHAFRPLSSRIKEVSNLPVRSTGRTVLCWLSVLLLAASPVTMASSDRPDTLVIGKISHNPKKHYHYLKPMADYVQKQMIDLGYKHAKVLMARDNRQMIRYLRSGKVDWVTETLMSAVELQRKSGAELLVKKWKKGQPEYHSIFFTRKGSGIQSISDLSGKSIAFEDPGSSTAYFIPAELLLRKGYRLVKLTTPRDKPPVDAVGYSFAREEINISTWVHKGLVDVGVMNNHDWNKEDHLPHIFQRDMQIIHRTESFPRAVELVRPGLEPGVKSRLKSILLNAHRDPAAQKVLPVYQETERFEELTPELRQNLNEIYKTVEFVRSRLNR